MYLYVVTLHEPSSKTEAKPQRAATALERLTFGSASAWNNSTRRSSNLQLRADPAISEPVILLPSDPMDLASNDILPAGAYDSFVKEAFEPPRPPVKKSAIRFLYLDEQIEEAALAKALDDYYTFQFHVRQLYKGDTAWIYKFEFTVRRVELPADATPESIQREHYPFFDISGAQPLEVRIASYIGDPVPSVATPYYTAPEQLNSEENVEEFVKYLQAWSTARKASAAWKKAQDSAKPSAPPAPVQSEEAWGNYACFSGPAPAPTAPKPELLAKKSVLASRERCLMFYDKKSQKPHTDRILFPCDLTPYVVPAIFPELTVKSISADTLSGALPYIRTGLLEKLSSTPGPEYTTVNAVTPADTAAKETEQELNVALRSLARTFEGEYIQQTRSKEFAAIGIPRNLLQAMWKVFAMNPKRSSLSFFTNYTDGYMGSKPLPAGWTAEAITEHFFKEISSLATADPIIKRGFKLMLGKEFIRLAKAYHGLANLCDYAPANSDHTDGSLNDLDFAPITQILIDPAGMTEETKKGWVKVFIREAILQTNEKSVLGSSDTYAGFLKWVRQQRWSMSYTDTAIKEIREAIIAQYPIAEFTRLMKANGFEMTRRARGMVYLGATWKSGCGLAEERVPSAGEVPSEKFLAGEMLPGAGEEPVLAATGEQDMLTRDLPVSTDTLARVPEIAPVEPITVMGAGAKRREARESGLPDGLNIKFPISNCVRNEDLQNYIAKRKSDVTSIEESRTEAFCQAVNTWQTSSLSPE